MKFKPVFALAALPFAVLVGCGGDDAVVLPEVVTPPMTVTIAHINDHHSNLATLSQSLKFNGKDTTAEIGGFARVKTAMDQMAGKPNLLKLHAGDALSGTLYYTLFKGEADAAMMNTVCFDAMAIGNHEFDEGDERLKSFITMLQAGSCKTPVLSANVFPKVGTPLAPTKVDDYIKPYTIKDFAGQKVAIVGLTIKGKTQGSSSPLSTTVFEDEATAAQKAIDALKAQGVQRIVLLSHIGYSMDKSIAAKLTDVDVIVGGDSHSLLGDFSAYGITSSSGSYATMAKNKDGDNVCIVQAWEYAKAMGELTVNFNAKQSVDSCSGKEHLLLGETFTRKDAAGKTVTLAGADLDEVKAIIAKDAQLWSLKPNASAEAVLKGYADKVDAMKKEVIGTATELLCLERIPGGGTSKTPGCTAATNAHGGDISNLVAYAFRDMSITSQIAIQNAGGVRIDVPAGDITIGTAYTLLPFANTLTELDMTGTEIKAVLEEAVEYAVKTGGSTGAYPYAAGLRWTVDLSKPAGSRFSNLEYKGKKDSAWSALNMSSSYKVVTNNFLAQGSDGYATFKKVSDSGRFLDTYLDYAQSFVDYTKKTKVLNKLPVSEYSTQAIYDKNGLLQQ
ncbi:MAG: bifunctional metallophosphatase/5'-nucleotidase [Gammaproteobacteria bacterium 28-57-27]|nr:MAG: bifunctional metallophosphatase/5'-nucleotidase [Gammaproteobacteria bacterium 28-57-27]